EYLTLHVAVDDAAPWLSATATHPSTGTVSSMNVTTPDGAEPLRVAGVTVAVYVTASPKSGAVLDTLSVVVVPLRCPDPGQPVSVEATRLLASPLNDASAAHANPVVGQVEATVTLFTVTPPSGRETPRARVRAVMLASGAPGTVSINGI